MEIEKIKKIIEAILFAAGRIVTEEEIILAVEKPKEDIKLIIQNMQEDYQKRGIELIKVDNGYQLCTKKEYYEYIYPIIDKRNKPRLSGASLEVLAIIAYNEQITRADIEAIRGVNSDASIYKLLEYGLIEEAGKLDLPGKPMSYRTTKEFLQLFGYESLESLPELPKYKMDENKQIVIEELVEENKEASKDKEDLGNKESSENKEIKDKQESRENKESSEKEEIKDKQESEEEIDEWK